MPLIKMEISTFWLSSKFKGIKELKYRINLLLIGKVGASRL
jgi:hypothetical protein